MNFKFHRPRLKIYAWKAGRCQIVNVFPGSSPRLEIQVRLFDKVKKHQS